MEKSNTQKIQTDPRFKELVETKRSFFDLAGVPGQNLDSIKQARESYKEVKGYFLDQGYFNDELMNATSPYIY